MNIFPNIALVPRREVCYFRFDEMVKEEEEYRLGNIMPMDQVREKVKKIIAKEGNYCRD